MLSDFEWGSAENNAKARQKDTETLLMMMRAMRGVWDELWPDEGPETPNSC